MTNSNNQPPQTLDQFLEKLDKQAQADGYPEGIISNMKQSPEMVDILMRMLGAELKAIKEEQKGEFLQS